MVLKNRIEISVPPKKLWGLVSDPVRIMSWNPKIRTVIPVTIGELRAGSQYRIRYHLFHGEGNYAAELMEFEEPVRCVLHLKGGNLPAKGYIQEIYEITEKQRGCQLTHTILIDQAGIFFLRAAACQAKALGRPGFGATLSPETEKAGRIVRDRPGQPYCASYPLISAFVYFHTPERPQEFRLKRPELAFSAAPDNDIPVTF